MKYLRSTTVKFVFYWKTYICLLKAWGTDGDSSWHCNTGRCQKGWNKNHYCILTMDFFFACLHSVWILFFFKVWTGCHQRMGLQRCFIFLFPLLVLCNFNLQVVIVVPSFVSNPVYSHIYFKNRFFWYLTIFIYSR